MDVPRRNIPDLEGLSLDHSATTTFVRFDQSFQIGSIDSSDGRNAGLQDLREAYLKIGSLRPSHYVFHSGCGLSNNCHPSGKMDGKTKSLYPVAEMDRLTKALLFTRTLCRANHRSRTGEAGRSLFDRY